MMISTLFSQWISDWRDRRSLFWLEMIGTVSSLIAAVLISFWPGIIHLSWVFSFWLVGSISLAISSYMRQAAWPMLLMITYTVFNLVGLWKMI